MAAIVKKKLQPGVFERLLFVKSALGKDKYREYTEYVRVFELEEDKEKVFLLLGTDASRLHIGRLYASELMKDFQELLEENSWISIQGTSRELIIEKRATKASEIQAPNIWKILKEIGPQGSWFRELKLKELEDGVEKQELLREINYKSLQYLSFSKKNGPDFGISFYKLARIGFCLNKLFLEDLGGGPWEAYWEADKKPDAYGHSAFVWFENKEHTQKAVFAQLRVEEV